MQRLIFFLSVFSIIHQGYTQNLNLYKQQVDTLCSSYFFGRGYTKKGHIKTAHYLKYTLKNIGYKVETQNFPIQVNTFPTCSNITINDSIPLVLGKDFIPSPESGSFKGTLKVFTIDSTMLTDSISVNTFLMETDSFAVLIDHQILNSLPENILAQLYKTKLLVLNVPEPLTGSLSTQVSHFAIIQVIDSLLPKTIQTIDININNQLYTGQSQNIIAYKDYSPSKPTLYFTAHYDHLGGYGKEVYISGANDNASGCAMLIDLANQTVNITTMYNIVFIFFGGEEVGLIGSRYYANNPKFSFNIKKDRLINLDLMGAGSKGITIENGINEPEIVNLFESTNKDLVEKIKLKGNRANSDHFPFTEKGLHAVFIFSLGNVGGYHNTLDDKKDLEYDSYKNLYQLIFNAVIEGFVERE